MGARVCVSDVCTCECVWGDVRMSVMVSVRLVFITMVTDEGVGAYGEDECVCACVCICGEGVSHVCVVCYSTHHRVMSQAREYCGGPPPKRSFKKAKDDFSSGSTSPRYFDFLKFISIF